jgi:hypothetical protein
MKKIVSLLLVVMLALSLFACNTSHELSEHSSSDSSKPLEPSRSILEQIVINRCCEYSNVENISIKFGTFNTVWDEEEYAWVTNVKGTYYPKDEFGNHDEPIQFGLKLHGKEIVEVTSSFTEVY